MRYSSIFRMLILLAVLECLGTSAAPAVTVVHLYGSPGSLEGRFENAQGEIDLQGWLGVECPEVGIQYLWQVSDFQAENLNSHGPGNHAMWAGQTAAQRPTWVNPPGYGDYWNTVMQWSRPAPTTVAPFVVELAAVYNNDVEPGYDFIHVEWNKAGVWQTLELIEGRSADFGQDFQPPGVALSHQWTVQPTDLVDGETQIRLRVSSDNYASDELGVFPFPDSNGAMQIDDITVSFDGVPVDGGGDPDGVASFESGDDEGWAPQPDTCACSVVSELAGDIDPGPDNLTPQIGHFISSSNPGTQVRRCSFESPVIAWNIPAAQGLAGTQLRFRSYYESNISSDALNVGVRSFVDGQWTVSQPVARFWTLDAGWQTLDFDLTPHIPTNAESIQIILVPFARHATEASVSFDDVEVMRTDSSITPAPPAVPTARVELAVYPNPTNPTSTIRYTVDATGPVRLDLFDARGRRVRTILEGSKPSGTHVARFDGLDDRGQAVVSGVYFVRLQADGQQRSARVVVVR